MTPAVIQAEAQRSAPAARFPSGLLEQAARGPASLSPVPMIWAIVTVRGQQPASACSSCVSHTDVASVVHPVVPLVRPADDRTMAEREMPPLRGESLLSGVGGSSAR